MTTVVITLPEFFPGEAVKIADLLRSGQADLVHLRKPGSSAAEMERLIRTIPADLHNRLVLHDHHHLAPQYGLHGIHLNSRNPEPPQGQWSMVNGQWSMVNGQWSMVNGQWSISRSCHTLDEVKQWKPRCQYVSLSPIFDSISKQGYRAAFSRQELIKAAQDGIIDSKVYALGGITFSRLNEVAALGFGGAMILGDAWKSPTPALP